MGGVIDTTYENTMAESSLQQLGLPSLAAERSRSRASSEGPYSRIDSGSFGGTDDEPYTVSSVEAKSRRSRYGEDGRKRAWTPEEDRRLSQLVQVSSKEQLRMPHLALYTSRSCAAAPEKHATVTRTSTLFVQERGPGGWAEHAKALAAQDGLPCRSGKSCRLRWCNHLNPDIKRTAFSPREDAVILEAHKVTKSDS